MKVKKLIDKLQENWPAKVICFLMALFFYIFFQISSLDSKSFSVPLRVHDANGLVVVSEIPKNVRVSLRGKAIELASITSKDLNAYINLDYITSEGSYRQPILLSLSENALVLDPLEVKVTPESISVDIEGQLTASAKINVLKSGKPAYGYEVKSIEITPKEALVSGPRSLIENYDRLQTEAIRLEGVSRDFTCSLGLINNSANVKIVDDFQVTADVSIGPVLITKKYDKLKVLYTEVNSGLEISSKTEELGVVLYGKLIDLEKYTPRQNAVSVNCASVTEAGTYDLPVVYSFPHYFEFDSTPPETVKVTFVQKTVEQLQEAPAQ